MYLNIWAFNVLIYIVTIWWGMFWWSSQQEWSYFQFLLLILYAILLFLSASLIFPWDIPDDFDFEEHFYETRPWFFAIFWPVITLTYLSITTLSEIAA